MTSSQSGPSTEALSLETSYQFLLTTHKLSHTFQLGPSQGSTAMTYAGLKLTLCTFQQQTGGQTSLSPPVKNI